MLGNPKAPAFAADRILAMLAGIRGGGAAALATDGVGVAVGGSIPACRSLSSRDTALFGAAAAGVGSWAGTGGGDRIAPDPEGLGVVLLELDPVLDIKAARAP